MTADTVKYIPKWITQGAKDDTPKNARQHCSRENPPRYAVPSNITSLDYSPDGTLIIAR